MSGVFGVFPVNISLNLGVSFVRLSCNVAMVKCYCMMQECTVVILVVYIKVVDVFRAVLDSCL